jgi:hypothetical protein
MNKIKTRIHGDAKRIFKSIKNYLKISRKNLTLKLRSFSFKLVLIQIGDDNCWVIRAGFVGGGKVGEQ